MVTRNEEWFTDNDIPDPDKKDLPIPCGWRMLVRPAGVIKKTKGGIILTDKNLEEQQYKDIMDVYENSLIKEVEEHSINGEPLEEYQRSA